MVTAALANKDFGSGRHAPARFLCALLALGLVPLAPVSAQQAAQQVSSVPVPGTLELSKLVWSTMAAVDHANQAGNYSVLRDLSAPGFQVNNDAARLTEIFASLRSSRVDLSNTLLLAPTYTASPAIIQPGVMRLQGYFGLRPTAINFDLFYQWVGGKWRLFGVTISPSQIASIQPGFDAPPPQKPPVETKPTTRPKRN